MSVFPVIVRELRAQARQPLTYWLRILGGISLAGAVGMAIWMTAASPTEPIYYSNRPTVTPNLVRAFGVALFGKLNVLVFVTIWLFVPLAAADAISRERREGTLPLLYLTQLRSAGIVLGKAFVHMLRSLSLFLTMAPWLMLPVLFGGVELRDIKMALLLDFTALLLAMCAGLFASSIPRDWLKSVLLAQLFAAFLLLGMLNIHGAVLGQAAASGIPAGVRPGTPLFWNSGYGYIVQFLPGSHYGEGWIAKTRRLLALTTNGTLFNFGYEDGHYWYSGRYFEDLESDWQQIWTGLTPAGHDAWFAGAFEMLAGAAALLVLTLTLAAWRVSKSWQDTPRQDRSELRQRFLAPRFAVPFLNRKLSRALTANPVGWLQIHSPPARMVKWAWCLFIIAVEILFSANPDDLYSAQAAVGFLLLLGMSFSATGSFRQELETGAFELLLVTPLRERQIITGRLRGLWRQFLPAMLVFGAGGLYLGSGWSDPEYSRTAWRILAKNIIAFLCLPCIGLYFSVRRWNFFAAWMGACLLGLLPGAILRAFSVSTSATTLAQGAVAGFCLLLLHRRLQNREFIQARSALG